jgi:hypothetical protein
VNFTNATADNQPIGNDNASPLTTVSNAGVTDATPSALTGGNAFTVTWNNSGSGAAQAVPANTGPANTGPANTGPTATMGGTPAAMATSTTSTGTSGSTPVPATAATAAAAVIVPGRHHHHQFGG